MANMELFQGRETVKVPVIGSKPVMYLTCSLPLSVAPVMLAHDDQVAFPLVDNPTRVDDINGGESIGLELLTELTMPSG